jgi:hypothetical protein
MAPEDPERHVGKRVVAQNGSEIGTVSEVREGSLWVEVGPDADPDVLASLRWRGVVNQEEHELENRFISDISEHVVRLRV